MGQLNLAKKWKQTLNHLRRSQGKANLDHAHIVNKLVDRLSAYLNEDSIQVIHGAYRFGAAAHSGQKRSSGEDYIFHPLEVALILADMHMDRDTIVAAILHDVVEDTSVTLEKVSERFGADVAQLVDGVSKVEQLVEESKEQAEAATFQKLFTAMSKDLRVIIIKLADRLHNMSTLDSLRQEKKQRIARQTLDIYAPIANRLGMGEMAMKLEDLSLKALDSDKYFEIIQKLESFDHGRKSQLEEICETVKQKLLQVGLNAEASGRKKHAYSIYRKMQQKNLTLDDVQDIMAIRIINEKRLDCYQALGVIHQIYKPRPQSFKDYIAIPKANGYQSLHTVVFGPNGMPLEVQIRSQAMHRVAEKGVASHWLYKTETTGEHAPQQLAKQWIKGFMELQEEFSKSGDYLEHLKADLFPDKVYVFTPKGEIKRLPRGSTALDFAYAVHSDIGNQCIAAYVNNKLVPLNEKLSNGDHVKIIISNKAQPLPSWLNYVVSSRARASIHKHLNGQERKESIKLGKRLLRNNLREQGFRKFHIPLDQRKRFVKQLNLECWDDLLSEIGLGKRLSALVAKQFIQSLENSSTEQQADPTMSFPLTIEGTEKLLTTYAKCCYPLCGDEIVGNINNGRGIVIHRSNCRNVRNFKDDPNHFLMLSWAENVQGEFQVKLDLTVKNSPGVLAKISNIIADNNSNIGFLNVDQSLHHTAKMSLVIEVRDRKHLADILRELHNVKTIIRLKRA